MDYFSTELVRLGGSASSLLLTQLLSASDGPGGLGGTRPHLFDGLFASQGHSLTILADALELANAVLLVGALVLAAVDMRDDLASILAESSVRAAETRAREEAATTGNDVRLTSPADGRATDRTDASRTSRNRTSTDAENAGSPVSRTGPDAAAEAASGTDENPREDVMMDEITNADDGGLEEQQEGERSNDSSDPAADLSLDARSPSALLSRIQTDPRFSGVMRHGPGYHGVTLITTHAAAREAVVEVVAALDCTGRAAAERAARDAAARDEAAATAAASDDSGANAATAPSRIARLMAGVGEGGAPVGRGRSVSGAAASNRLADHRTVAGNRASSGNIAMFANASPVVGSLGSGAGMSSWGGSPLQPIQPTSTPLQYLPYDLLVNQSVDPALTAAVNAAAAALSSSPTAGAAELAARFGTTPPFPQQLALGSPLFSQQQLAVGSPPNVYWPVAAGPSSESPAFSFDDLSNLPFTGMERPVAPMNEATSPASLNRFDGQQQLNISHVASPPTYQGTSSPLNRIGGQQQVNEGRQATASPQTNRNTAASPPRPSTMRSGESSPGIASPPRPSTMRSGAPSPGIASRIRMGTAARGFIGGATSPMQQSAIFGSVSGDSSSAASSVGGGAPLPDRTADVLLTPGGLIDQLSHLSLQLLCCTHRPGQPAFDFYLATPITLVHSVRVLLSGALSTSAAGARSPPAYPITAASFVEHHHSTLVRGLWLAIVLTYVTQLRPTLDPALLRGDGSSATGVNRHGGISMHGDINRVGGNRDATGVNRDGAGVSRDGAGDQGYGASITGQYEDQMATDVNDPQAAWDAVFAGFRAHAARLAVNPALAQHDMASGRFNPDAVTGHELLPNVGLGWGFFAPPQAANDMEEAGGSSQEASAATAAVPAAINRHGANDGLGSIDGHGTVLGGGDGSDSSIRIAMAPIDGLQHHHHHQQPSQPPRPTLGLGIEGGDRWENYAFLRALRSIRAEAAAVHPRLRSDYLAAARKLVDQWTEWTGYGRQREATLNIRL